MIACWLADDAIPPLPSYEEAYTRARDLDRAWRHFLRDQRRPPAPPAPAPTPTDTPQDQHEA